MMTSNDDTIAAIATPVGQAGIGIIRVSGPESFSIARKIFRPKQPRPELHSHRLYLGHILDPDSGAMVDEVLFTRMKAPHTYTREDIIEIQSHSGYVLLSKILRILMQHGARLAMPGEFTFRAFVNGRIDLTQAEAIVDIINAKSERGLQLSSEQIKGSLKRDVRKVREKAIDILAHVEVALDFPEEGHEILSNEEGVSRIKEHLTDPLQDLIDAHAGRQVWVEGVNTVIIGRVNVGKSSLLNRLLDEQRAIVTAIPGTTRDIIESTLNIEGVPLRLMDTAGLRDVSDQVERIGIQLTREKLETADLILMVVDQSEPLEKDDHEILEGCIGRKALVVLNKADLPGKLSPGDTEKITPQFKSVSISALTGEGLNQLRKTIVDFVLTEGQNLDVSRVAPNLRQKQALEQARTCFMATADALRDGLPMEIVALELKSGLDFLGQITGATTPEDVLKNIFSHFCLGK
ncbi:MAG: tRNA uridine-5-carboxymethylaminomethyl(34) synthesis GTPase MnmE [Desulfatiglandaceae bacterium]|jgi:tRNA modification GTPase